MINRYFNIKILVVVILIFIFSSQVLADKHVDWKDEANFETNFKQDPAAGFKANPEQAWSNINSKPALLKDPKILAAAFNDNRDKALEVIEKDSTNYKVNNLLNDDKVLNKFDEEAKKDHEILNKYPKSKKRWFRSKYKIDDKGSSVTSYDGNKITVAAGKGVLSGLQKKLVALRTKEGVDPNERIKEIRKLRIQIKEIKGKSTSFDPKSFPGATVLEDGTLKDAGNIYIGTSSLIKAKNDAGQDIILMNDGRVNLDDASKKNVKLDVTNGEVKITVSSPEGKLSDSEVVYKGSFSYENTKEGEKISSTCKKKCPDKQKVIRKYISRSKGVSHRNRIRFTGSVIQPPNTKVEQFLIAGSSRIELYSYEIDDKTQLDFKPDGTVLEVKSNVQVLYTEERSRNADRFCSSNAKISCVVNTPGAKKESKYWSRLSFQNVQNNDEIKVTSTHYYDKLDVKNLVDGKITFKSLQKSGSKYRTVSTIQIDKKNGIKGRGNLAKLNAGRVDYYFEENKQQKLQHLSTTQHMSPKVPPGVKNQIPGVPEYFGSNKKITTCSVGINCEEKMVAASGKTIKGKNGGVSTLIIVAGDHATLAKSARKLCKRTGCYIVNSRDVPPTTSATRVVISGHHYANDDTIWRDAPGTIAKQTSDHNPIDVLHFKDIPKERQNGQVKEVGFSACETVRAPMTIKKGTNEPHMTSKGPDKVKVYDGFYQLGSKYSGLRTVVGQHGNAPYTEPIEKVVGREQKGVISFVPNSCAKDGCLSFKARYLAIESSSGKEWYWTGDGNNCYNLKNPSKIINCQPRVAQK